MAFKLEDESDSAPDDPEALFRDLRRRTVPGLLSHQADVLRSYVGIHDKHTDIAIQLPTGSGKTLVGLLLAEWRRRKFGERVLYLCPTNQLVHQVALHAVSKYGLNVHSFVGSKAEYDGAAASDWQEADAIAITNYSSLFNIRPFFDEPQVIVLDDAHSAENYIGNCWSLLIERFKKEHQALFTSILNLVSPHLSPPDRSSLLGSDSQNVRWVDKLPTPLFEGLIPELIAIVDEHSKGLLLRYQWQMLRGSLTACHFYVSPNAFLIRPLIPPTSVHAPFSGARQRVYMSATLGAGGDLERITGRSPIHRLPVPPGWDKQGIGRRFFIFPQRSLDDDETPEFTAAAIDLAKRAFFLVADDRTAEETRESVRALGYPVFDAKQIEESKEPFVKSDKAVAVVANRYDGIDLVDDECRLLLVEGLPRGANLQEKFLVSRMGAGLILDDRILTRVVQGFGRCTRSPNDFAAVVVIGDDLQKYLLSIERRQFLHPEIQAELQFGLSQSKEMSLKEMIQNLDHFLNQDDEWAAADAAIVKMRSKLARKELPAAGELSKTVAAEIQYLYAMWDGNYLDALEQCRSVLGMLNQASLRGYRSLWLYLAGSAAHLAFKHKALRDDRIAKEYFEQAAKAAPGLRWLMRLLHSDTVEPGNADSRDPVWALVERLESVFISLGTTHDRKFAAEEKDILQDILQSDDGDRFEVGHERLGRLLGFDSHNSDNDAAPDPWWIVDSSLCFVFEDYSEAKADSPLAPRKARQAASHPNWIRENVALAKDARIVPVLLTNSKVLGSGSKPHLKDVKYWNLDAFQEWAKRALGAIRELRNSFPGEGDLMWRADAANKLQQVNIAPIALLERILVQSAAEAMIEQ